MLAFGKAECEQNVIAFDIACLLQALTKCAQTLRERCSSAKKPNHRHRRLLRARRERPRRRAAEQRDELAPFQCPGPPVLPTGSIARLRAAGDCCIHLPGRYETIAVTPPKIFSKEVAPKQATLLPRQDLLTARNRFRPNFRG